VSRSGPDSRTSAANFSAVLGRLVGLPRFVALQFFLGFLALNHLIDPLSNLFEIVGFRTMRPPNLTRLAPSRVTISF
jgi:hypothetical protein